MIMETTLAEYWQADTFKEMVRKQMARMNR